MKYSQTTLVCLAGAILSVAIVSGCDSGPATGSVEGVVTLDGQPLEDAMVSFQPQDGRRSIGMTDQNGRYKLRFTATADGAIPGEHKVAITTARAESGGEGNEPLVPAREEILPAKYHADTELTATVEPGDNQIDFDLTSE